jgi:hypothetical protein
MAINASIQKREFEIVPAGNHVARVYSIIHIGTIPGEYMGEPKQTDTVRIGFELPLETRTFKEAEPEKPFVIAQDFTLSMNEKAKLRHLVEGILGVGFYDEEAATYDITQLMGATCMLNVIQKKSQAGNMYAKIAGAAPLPKGMTSPPTFNAPFILDFSENWDDAKFDALPDFIKDKIKSSTEYQARKSPDDVMNENNPF